MLIRRIAISLVLALAVTLPASAQGFEKGWAAYKRGDYVTTVIEWRALAEMGDVSAQINLGVIFRTGYGVAQDYAKAVKWYSKAAAQENANAQYSLGLMHFNGNGVVQDLVLAHLWFSLSADKGNKYGSEARDLAAMRMTRFQTAEAQKLVRAWREKHPKKRPSKK